MPPGRSSPMFHPHFSPWLADSEQLSRSLVGHHDIVRDFLSRLQGVEQGGTASHMLLVGPRGIGKTHVLCLVERYVSGQLPVPQGWTGPSKDWVCILFTEEEYAGQNSLPNFLLTLFSKLLQALPVEPLWKLPAHLQYGADAVILDCCFERLQRFHAEKRNKILLVIDNLQKILQQWPEGDHQRLRSFLSHNNLLVILGSAPSVFRGVMDQKAAFHDFFEIRILPELSNEQMLELLSRRFEEDGRQRDFQVRREELSKKIPAIALLTGGNPRLVLFLYQIATRSTFLDIEVALRNLLEELREYFVHRLEDLPDQARKVLDTVAQMPGPATPTEISHAARLQPALVNAQLKRLKEGHYIRAVKFLRQKSTRYDITEQLFRIWRQTATVAGRQRFRFLADFLKLYFTPEEIGALYAHHLQYLDTTSGAPREEIISHIDELFYFQEAGSGRIRCEAFSNRVESLVTIGEMNWAKGEVQYFLAESIERQDKLGVKTAFKTQAAIDLHAGRYSDAIEDVKRLVDLGAEKEALGAIIGLIEKRAQSEAALAAQSFLKVNPRSAGAWACLGVALGNQGEYGRAAEAFRKAAEAERPTAQLWTYQAFAFSMLNRWEEALRCAEAAVALDDGSVDGWKQLGVAASNLGHYERALGAFRKAAEGDKPTAGLRTNEATALNRLNRWEEALGYAEEAVALDADSSDGWEQLGVAAGNLGMYERGLGAFRKAAEGKRPTARLRTNEAIVLNKLRRWEEALRCAEEAVAIDAYSIDGWEQLGIAVGGLGAYDRALEAFRRAAEVGKPTARLWTNQAVALNSLGRWEEALRCAEEAVILDADSSDGWEQLGIAVGNSESNERALEAFRRAAELGKRTAGLWTNQAIALNKLGRWQEAMRCAEDAVALDASSAVLWEQLGMAAGNFGAHEKALEAFRKVAEFGKPTARLWMYQAIALNNLGRWEEALRCADEAVALDAKSAEGWEQVGIAAGNLGAYERALEAFRKVAEAGKPTAALRTNEAIALNKLGRWQEALRCAEEAVALDASNGEGWRSLAVAASSLGACERALEALRKAAEAGKPTAALWTAQAIVLNNLERWEEALRCAEEAVALDAGSGAGWEQLGVAAFRRGQPERALEALRKAAELGKTDTDILRLQATILQQLGRFEEAASVIERALESQPGAPGLWLEKAWLLARLDRAEEALRCVEMARERGVNDRTYHQDRGNLLLLGGRFLDALNELDAGLEVNPADWDLQADRIIALGCLGKLGPLMEALPASLAEVQVPPGSLPAVCDFMYDISLNCLRRGDTQTSRGLFAATLETKSWHASEWFGKQAGSLLRRLLDVEPKMFRSFSSLLAEKVKDENVLQLLDPFLKASDFLGTENLSILERLFPEVRELVLDIVRRVDPEMLDDLGPALMKEMTSRRRGPA